MGFSTSIIIGSAGELSVAPGTEIAFNVYWTGYIDQYRWSRVWPAIFGASDEATFQKVTIVSEGSQWNYPSSNSLAYVVRGDGNEGTPVTFYVQVMASQTDSF